MSNSSLYNRDGKKETELVKRLKEDCVEGAGKLPPVVLETFIYFDDLVRELETRIEILEEGMERLGPIIGHKKRGGEDE